MKIKLLFLLSIAALTTTFCMAAGKPQQSTSKSKSKPAPTPEATSQNSSDAMTGSSTGSEKYTYNNCKVDGPYIAMTFDDGPHPKLTPRLLDMLKERGLKATFFLIGQNAAANPEIVQRIVAEGHELGNHSWDHKALNKMGADGVKMEIVQTNEAIQQAVGIKPVIMRPPYGATSPAISKRLNEEFGQKVIMWSVDPLDWKDRNASLVTDRILKNTAPGAIILAHDIHQSTVDAMPATLDGLLSKGFKFATVSELIKMDQAQSVQSASTSPATPAAQPKASAAPYMR